MKYFKPIIVLFLVFTAGISIGVVGTRYVVKRNIRQAITRPELVRLRVEHELTRELSLTPEQQTKLDGILTGLQQDIAKARKERMPRIRPIFAEAQSRINEILTPDQLEKFERYQTEYGFFSLGGQGQGQGQNFPRLQKLKKLREGLQNNQPSPAAATPPAAQPPPSTE